MSGERSGSKLDAGAVDAHEAEEAAEVQVDFGAEADTMSARELARELRKKASALAKERRKTARLERKRRAGAERLERRAAVDRALMEIVRRTTERSNKAAERPLPV